jgi:hypothetical protein
MFVNIFLQYDYEDGTVHIYNNILYIYTVQYIILGQWLTKPRPPQQFYILTNS